MAVMFKRSAVWMSGLSAAHMHATVYLISLLGLSGHQFQECDIATLHYNNNNAVKMRYKTPYLLDLPQLRTIDLFGVVPAAKRAV